MPAFVDLTGKNFYRWTVLNIHTKKIHNRNHWLCKCECGTERVISSCILNSGRSKSCGCLKIERTKDLHNKKTNIAGQQFGFLKAVKRGEPKVSGSAKNLSTWVCECVCGNIGTYLTNSLKSGNTKSCGCKSAFWAAEKNFKGSIRILETGIFCQYKRAARRKKLEFLLNRDQFVSILKLNCHYCGKSPSNLIKRAARKFSPELQFKYNGIDRVDNARGYKIDNVVPCCRECNTIKHDSLTYDEMKAVAQFLKFFRSKGKKFKYHSVKKD